MKKPLKITFASYIKFLRDYCPEFRGEAKKTSIQDGLIIDSALLKICDSVIVSYEDCGREDNAIKFTVTKTFTFKKVDDMTTVLCLKTKNVKIA